MIHRIFRINGDDEAHYYTLLSSIIPSIATVETEYCFNFSLKPETSSEDFFVSDSFNRLIWLLGETFEQHKIRPNNSFFQIGQTEHSNLRGVQIAKFIDGNWKYLIEVGPRLAFSTAWSSNCLSMCSHCGINSLERIERSRRFLITSRDDISQEDFDKIFKLLHDRMTETVYSTPLDSFNVSHIQKVPVRIVPILEQGKQALIDINNELGLGFDQHDINYYSDIFINQLKRNPTDVECFDLGQSNSEHSRHWFFGGKMTIDGEEKEHSLFQLVKNTLPKESNSVIAFHDNSSSIYGFKVDTLVPTNVLQASSMELKNNLVHPILTAETHNFPSGVAPFPGAETGTGGRIRDVQATGRGASTLAGINGYCVGNLNIPGYNLDWEKKEFEYPDNLASPLKIIVDASSGASDYGNKYGEPAVGGFTRSFGNVMEHGERFEWLKPIMFTAGVGMMNDNSKSKGEPEVGMVVCKIGGPAYRIGMGGGAASSRVQGSGDAELDFNAVQRGDAEMENRMNRFVRACIEMGEDNPIVSIHDQGAGGNGNVLKEIVDPLGAVYDIKDIPLGDPTLSVMEIWGAEYQENNAFLAKPESVEKLIEISQRENCPFSMVGTVSGSGNVVLKDEDSTPFNMPLSLVLGKMPRKEYNFTTSVYQCSPIKIPEGATVSSLLEKVLRLLDVGSKRFLTNKVDRSVTGLVAQQQCVGPLHTPLSNVSVLAQSHFGKTGVAVAVGEQPIKGLIDCEAQANLTVIEALSNLAFAKITKLQDVKASCNWMWASKLEGEGAKMYKVCEKLTNALIALGPGIDGGKDSLSMAAKVGNTLVKSPGQVTLTCYASCPDITKTITPDFKQGGNDIIYIDLGKGKSRIGGSALATVLGNLGNESPNFNDYKFFIDTFNCIQSLLDDRLLLSGHDRSDGGLIVTLLEMAFSGNLGFDISIPVLEGVSSIEALFGEEPGFIFEVDPKNTTEVVSRFMNNNIIAHIIGKVTNDHDSIALYGTELVLSDSIIKLRDIWEETSFMLEYRQCNPHCVTQEKNSLAHRKSPQYFTSYEYDLTPEFILKRNQIEKPRVAILRQEGTNGDREMLSAFYAAGFNVWDINMHDLLNQKIYLDGFRGVVFCGGFSYADVNGSSKGWAGVIKFNERLLSQFTYFRDREDTFSLGVCNGCQLMTLLGWVPFPNLKFSSEELSFEFSEENQARFLHNTSGRFESRWSTLKVLPSPSVLLKGMENSNLGIWVAHGEGKVYFPDSTHYSTVLKHGLAPLRYTNDSAEITEDYPFNPNGSQSGIAALCSFDGRHLAMMPHPERCFLSWQLPHKNEGINQREAGPWIKLFQNAYKFCESK